MIATTVKRQRWDTEEYQRITGVRYSAPNLHVTFADGDDVAVPVAWFERANAYLSDQAPDWTRVALGPEHEIVAPGKTAEIGIPWDFVRGLTDPAYAAVEEEEAVEIARRVGRRFRQLREERGLALATLAKRTDLSPSIIESVEAGTHPGDPRLHDRLLAAMGFDYRALIPAEGGSDEE